jgi:hypothetical protein
VAENLIEAVERLELVIGRIERLMYGEPPGRPGGLLAEVEGLRRDVQGLREDVHRLKSRRPNIWVWAGGYLVFLVSGAFALVGAVNQVLASRLWDIPPVVAMWLAVMLAGGALIMFLGGFGWLDRG